MSKQTHPFREPAAPPPSRWRGDPTKGADLEAPTAPHAEPRLGTPIKPSGPAKFWGNRRARIALIVGSLLSIAFHWEVAPWRLLPDDSGVSLKDPEGDLAIPVDLLGEEPPPAPPEPAPTAAPAPEPTPNPDDPNAPGKLDAGPPKKPKDAGVNLATLDGGAEDEDGGALSDAGAPSDAGVADAGLWADYFRDGGTPGSTGLRDPEAMFGLTKVVNAGVQNIVLGVNTALIRTHPVGGRIGPVLQAIRQWRDFLRGPSTVDPVRDTDSILIYGPSLINTDKDAVLVRYNASDQVVDQTIAGIAKAYDKGGPFDAGVPGVKGSLGFADNGPRVFLHPQPKLLVIVPPSHAHEAALVFKKQVPRGPPPMEAVRLIMKSPGKNISVRGLKLAETLTEIRLWVVPRDDGGADIYAEGDCTDEAAAADLAARLTELGANQNTLVVRVATHGVLNNAKVVAEGSKLTLHIHATQDQLEAILQVAAAAAGVTVAPPPAPAGSGSSRPTFPPPNE